MEREEIHTTENEEENEIAHQQSPAEVRKKGGLITMPFIIANESFERVASYGILPNMVFYLIRDYRLSVVKSSSILYQWNAATNFTPLVGAFIADSYLGRFATIAIGSVTSFMGMVLLWLTTAIPEARPPPCSDPNPANCKPATSAQMAMLLSSFFLLSMGAGGIRSASMPFGIDQLQLEHNANRKKILETFFNWYYASASISVVIALTVIVYLQDHRGWRIGFGVPAILMFLSASLFLVAAPLYIKTKANKSLLTGFMQVIVVAFKKRNLATPSPNSKCRYHRRKGSNLLTPSERLRFLNKGCIITHVEQADADGSASDSWSLCTVDQVEELKILIRVLPIWSTGILAAVNAGQSSFPQLQANSMDRHLTKNFEIPAGSFGTFLVICLIVWLIFYDRVLLPVASKIRGKQVRISPKNRIGIGLVINCLSVISSALIERARRRKAIDEGFENNPLALLDMSAMWLLIPNGIGGIAEAFIAVGQNEFFYHEFPNTMKSISSSLFFVGYAMGSLLSSGVVNAVDSITSRGGKVSWVADNINRGHIDRFYWILAILNAVNVVYYLICSWAYGPSADQGPITSEIVGSNANGLMEVGNGHAHEHRDML